MCVLAKQGFLLLLSVFVSLPALLSAMINIMSETCGLHLGLPRLRSQPLLLSNRGARRILLDVSEVDGGGRGRSTNYLTRDLIWRRSI